MKDNFFITIETLHAPDDGVSENVSEAWHTSPGMLLLAVPNEMLTLLQSEALTVLYLLLYANKHALNTPVV